MTHTYPIEEDGKVKVDLALFGFVSLRMQTKAFKFSVVL